MRAPFFIPSSGRSLLPRGGVKKGGGGVARLAIFQSWWVHSEAMVNGKGRIPNSEHFGLLNGAEAHLMSTSPIVCSNSTSSSVFCDCAGVVRRCGASPDTDGDTMAPRRAARDPLERASAARFASCAAIHKLYDADERYGSLGNERPLSRLSSSPIEVILRCDGEAGGAEVSSGSGRRRESNCFSGRRSCVVLLNRLNVLEFAI